MKLVKTEEGNYNVIGGGQWLNEYDYDNPHDAIKALNDNGRHVTNEAIKKLKDSETRFKTIYNAIRDKLIPSDEDRNTYYYNSDIKTFICRKKPGDIIPISEKANDNLFEKEVQDTPKEENDEVFDYIYETLQNRYQNISDSPRLHLTKEGGCTYTSLCLHTP